MEFTYNVRISDQQIKQVDRVIKNYLACHTKASVDDALDTIFAIGANVLDMANADTPTLQIGQK